MCGFGREHNAPQKFMKYNDFIDIFEKIKKHTMTIRLNGRGESTIHPNFKEIVKYVGDSGRKISLFTNGNYQDIEINQLFIQYEVQLFVSVDSASKNVLESIRFGADFDRINSNLDALLRLKDRPFIVFTLQEANFNEIISIAEYAISKNCHLIYNVVRRDHGMEPFVDMVIENEVNLSNSFDIALDMMNKRGLTCLTPDQIAGISLKTTKVSTYGSQTMCPALNREICIYYNGDVGPCNMFNPYRYGNINIDSFDDIWNGKNRESFIIEHKKHYYCQNCACLLEEIK
jgi:MoaA/NifB/PqqE/SkfB family radical SAM enzyme